MHGIVANRVLSGDNVYSFHGLAGFVTTWMNYPGYTLVNSRGNFALFPANHRQSKIARRS